MLSPFEGVRGMSSGERAQSSGLSAKFSPFEGGRGMSSGKRAQDRRVRRSLALPTGVKRRLGEGGGHREEG